MHSSSGTSTPKSKLDASLVLSQQRRLLQLDATNWSFIRTKQIAGIKLLQFVNSSFFGLPQRIETPLQAASLFGLRLVRSLVLSAGDFSQYENAALPLFTLEGLMPEQFTTVVNLVKANGITLAEADLAVFRTTHANVGAYLLQPQNFPSSLVDAVAFHQSPGMQSDTEPTTLLFLQVANALAAEQCFDRP